MPEFDLGRIVRRRNGDVVWVPVKYKKRKEVDMEQLGEVEHLPVDRVQTLFDSIGFQEDAAKLGTHHVLHSTCCDKPVTRFKRTPTRTEYTCTACKKVRATATEVPTSTYTMRYVYVAIPLPPMAQVPIKKRVKGKRTVVKTDLPSAGWIIIKITQAEHKARGEAKRWVFDHCFDRNAEEATWINKPSRKVCRKDSKGNYKPISQCPCDGCKYDWKCKKLRYWEIVADRVVPGETARAFAARMGCGHYDTCKVHSIYAKSKEKQEPCGRAANCPWQLAMEYSKPTGRRPGVNSPLVEGGTRVLDPKPPKKDKVPNSGGRARKKTPPPSKLISPEDLLKVIRRQLKEDE